MTNELNLDNVNERYLQAEALIDVIHTMEQARGVSFTHVLALESAIPGLVMDNYPEGGFTPHVSQKNAELVYTAVNNWLASNGITVERHATESWGTAGKILAGVGIFAAVVALIKWIMGLFGKGGKGGSGDITAPVNKPTQVISEMDKIIKVAGIDFEEEERERGMDASALAKKRAEEKAQYEKAKAISEKEFKDAQDAIKKEELYDKSREQYRDGLIKALTTLVSDAVVLEKASKSVLWNARVVGHNHHCADIGKDVKDALAVQVEKVIHDDLVKECTYVSKCLLESEYKANMSRLRDFVSAIAGVISSGELSKVTSMLKIITNGGKLASDPEVLKHLKKEVAKLPSKETISIINGLSLDRYTDAELISKREELLSRAPAMWPFFKEIATDLEKIMGEDKLGALNTDLIYIDRGLANALKEANDGGLREEITVIKDSLTTGLKLGISLCNSVRQTAKSTIGLSDTALILRRDHNLLMGKDTAVTVAEFKSKFKDAARPSSVYTTDILARARELTDIELPPGTTDAWSKFMNSGNPFTF